MTDAQATSSASAGGGSHEPPTAQPKGPSRTMAKARAAVHSDRVADAERGRARTASLPSLEELELTAEQIAEETVTVAQAAELTGVSVQAIDQLIVRGSLVAYRDAKGRRVITVDDLVDSRPARRQANRLAEERERRAWAEYRHATLEQPDCQAQGFGECHVCAAEAADEMIETRERETKSNVPNTNQAK